MKQVRLYFFLFSLLWTFSALAQDEEDNKKIDSIKTALTTAKHDTTRIKLYLALAENIYDPEVWPVYNQKSISIAEQLINSRDTAVKKIATQALANGFNNKGYYFSSVGRYDSAMYYYLKSTELMLKSKDKEGSAIVLMNIGLLLNNKGDYVGSIDYYYKSLRIFESIKNEIGLSQIYNNLASVFNYLKDEAKAKEYFYKSIEIKKRLNNPVLLSNGYNNLGSYFDQLKNYDSAHYYYNKALIIKRKYRDIYGIMNLYNNIGASYMDQHKYDSAAIYVNKSLNLAEKNHFVEGMAYSYNNLSELRLKENKLLEAKAFAEKALDIGTDHKILKVILTAYKNLTFAYKGMRDFEKAMFYSNNYHKLNDSLFNSDKQRSIAVLQIKHDYEKEQFADSVKRAGLHKENELRHQAEVQKQKTFSYIGITIAVFMFLVTLLLFNRYKIKQRNNKILEEKNAIILSQKEKVTQQKELIERKSIEVMDSINYAKRIQLTLLAHKDYLQNNLSDHFVLFKPKDIVSGDFYWATKVKSGNEDLFYLAVCDSTGHGVPGAFMSLLNISFLNEAINERRILSPDKIFDYVRARLIENMNREGQKDGFDGVLFCFNQSNNKITYAAANNAPVLMCGEKLDELTYDRMPVGSSLLEKPFNLYEISLKERGMLYVYTDGYADQFGGEKGKKFKYKQLNELLYNIRSLSVTEQHSKLELTFDKWKGSLEQVDDVCVIGIKI